jgi:N-acetylglucosaminyl-diphospho-decaprenol L-rhamnosyltransferase
MISLDIVIVNWNTDKQLYDCLKSIESTEMSGIQLNSVVIVDNNSTDDSLGKVDLVNLPLSIIQNNVNKGFGFACNQGAKNSQADYLLFLNPDTRLFEESLSKPIEFMEKAENSEIGICGIQLVDELDHVSKSCSYFPSVQAYISNSLGLNYILPKSIQHMIPKHPMLDWDHMSSRRVDQVIGAFFLVRRSLFENLNGFDNRFFVYFEEVDFSFRAYKLGWKSYYLSTTQAFHKGNGSTDKVKAHRLFYSLRSRIQYFRKHADSLSLILLIIATLFIEPLSRILLLLIKLSFKEIMNVFFAYRMLLESFITKQDMPS